MRRLGHGSYVFRSYSSTSPKRGNDSGLCLDAHKGAEKSLLVEEGEAI